jgi:hypothetical protein
LPGTPVGDNIRPKSASIWGMLLNDTPANQIIDPPK